MSAIAVPAPGANVLALIGQQLGRARQAEKDQDAAREAEALRAIEALAAGLRWDLGTEAEAGQSIHADRIANTLDAVWSASGGDCAA